VLPASLALRRSQYYDTRVPAAPVCGGKASLKTPEQLEQQVYAFVHYQNQYYATSQQAARNDRKASRAQCTIICLLTLVSVWTLAHVRLDAPDGGRAASIGKVRGSGPACCHS